MESVHENLYVNWRSLVQSTAKLITLILTVRVVYDLHTSCYDLLPEPILRPGNELVVACTLLIILSTVATTTAENFVQVRKNLENGEPGLDT